MLLTICPKGAQEQFLIFETLIISESPSMTMLSKPSSNDTSTALRAYRLYLISYYSYTSHVVTFLSNKKFL